MGRRGPGLTGQGLPVATGNCAKRTATSAVPAGAAARDLNFRARPAEGATPAGVFAQSDYCAPTVETRTTGPLARPTEGAAQPDAAMRTTASPARNRTHSRHRRDAGYILLDVLVGFAVLAIGAGGVYVAARNIASGVQRIHENSAYIAELELAVAEGAAKITPGPVLQQ